MDEFTHKQPALKSPPPSFLKRMLSNPVVSKELRTRMRGSRAFVVLTIYLILLSVAIGIIIIAYLSSRNSVGIPDLRQPIGRAIFAMIFGIELFTISFIAPALTAGAISSERERQTYDLLRTTLLSARSLVLGKLASSLSYIVLLLSAALPLQILAFIFGGVAVEEVLIGNLLLVITAITLSAVGLFFSSFTKHTLVSTILAYALTTILVLGLPIFLLIAIALFDSVLFRTGFPSNVFAVAFLILGSWFIISLNPIATAVVSEMILIEEQSAFYLAFPIGSGNTIQIISPWISFVIIYLLLSTLMVCFSIHFVNQIEK